MADVTCEGGTTVLISQRPALTEEPIADNRSRFVIEPLEPGFGYTLGNSLRRTLLSSIPGAAVTSIRIDGVLHEFTTVPGVKEDVTELILNLKELVVSSEERRAGHHVPAQAGPRRRHRRRHRAAGRRHRAQPRPEARHPEQEGQARDRAGRRARPRLRPGRRRTRSSAPRSAASRSTRSTRRCSRSPTASRPPASSSAPTSTGWCSTSRPSRRSPRGTRWPRPAPPWSSCSAWPAS